MLRFHELPIIGLYFLFIQNYNTYVLGIWNKNNYNWGVKSMKGTAILFREDQNVTIIEDIDHDAYKELKNTSECKDRNHHPYTKKDSSTVFPALWHDEEVDWDYGY